MIGAANPTWSNQRSWLDVSRLEKRPGRYEFSPQHSQAWFLAQVCCVVIPPLLLLGLGRVAAAGRSFWYLFWVVLAWQALRGKREQLLAFLLALGPAINLLRAFATYNIVVVLYALALGYYASGNSPGFYQVLGRRPIWAGMLLCVTVYWLASFYHTKDYSVNLRLYELVFSVAAMLLIGNQGRVLGAMFLGLIVTSIGVGMSMLPHYLSASGSARLGMVVVDGYALGNPVQLGVPLALSFLVLSSDRGLWLFVKRARPWQVLLFGPVVVLLAFTTSRAAWGMALLGVAISIIFGRQQRLEILLVLLAAGCALALLMRSSWSEAFSRGVTRTFSSEGSLAHRTSGRSDQWQVAWHAFKQSPRSMLIGHGPGSGADVYVAVSPLVEGVQYGVGERVALHSLLMQVLVETGALGIVVLVGALGWMVGRAYRWARQSGALLPLACLVGYIFVVLTVSGNDTVSGILLGLGLLASSSLERSHSDPRLETCPSEKPFHASVPVRRSGPRFESAPDHSHTWKNPYISQTYGKYPLDD